MADLLEDYVIVFDLDGTLVDTAPDLTVALNDTLAKPNRPRVTKRRAPSSWVTAIPTL